MSEPRSPSAARRLLIVDDQASNVRVMAEALKGEYELLFATSGAKALEMARAGGIDLVLLDVVMPELDGFEVCRRLKADPLTAGTPVIFVTASEETEEEAHGFDVGAVDYITKPIRPPVVRARVRTHIELKESRNLLEQLAMIDPLTGIANRRRFDACLEVEWQRAARGGRWLSLGLVDVDFFKRFNDTYGHARGDECLRAVAHALADVSRRPGDLVARYGGEEFGLVLPDTEAIGMRQVLEALLHRIGDLGIAHAGAEEGGNVTVSVGAVTLVPRLDQTPPTALEIADRLLYDAKRGGRARGVHFDVRHGERLTIGPLAALAVATQESRHAAPGAEQGDGG